MQSNKFFSNIFLNLKIFVCSGAEFTTNCLQTISVQFCNYSYNIAFTLLLAIRSQRVRLQQWTVYKNSVRELETHVDALRAASTEWTSLELLANCSRNVRQQQCKCDTVSVSGQLANCSQAVLLTISIDLA